MYFSLFTVIPSATIIIKKCIVWYYKIAVCNSEAYFWWNENAIGNCL